jgi:EmrB/QacA subfamily drug resistance transporter
METMRGMGTVDSKLRLGSAAGRGTLAAAVLASGMAFLDSTVVNVALPSLGRDFNATVPQLQWILNGYTLTLAAFVLLGGALGDRYGRRKIFLLGVLWFSVASLACGLAQEPITLIIARIVQGVGAALLTPGSLALIQASFEPEERGKAIGAWSGLSGVTTAIGPFLGGVLIDQASWRWIFFMNLPLAAVAVFLTLKYVPESSDADAAKRFDIAGAVLGALALAGLTYGLISPGMGGWIALGLALVAGIAFVLVERARRERAMMPLNLFGNRVFSSLNIYTVIVYGAFGGLFFLLVIFLQNVLGYSALEAGIATLPITIILLLFSSRSGALAQKIGPRLQLVAGPLLCAAGALWLRWAGDNYWTTVLPGVLVFSVGLVLLVAPLTTAVLGALAVRYAGVASGINNAAARAGALIAVAALPLLVGLAGDEYAQPGPLAGSYRAAAVWCAAFLAIGGLIALTLPKHVRAEDPQATSIGNS